MLDYLTSKEDINGIKNKEKTMEKKFKITEDTVFKIGMAYFLGLAVLTEISLILKKGIFPFL